MVADLPNHRKGHGRPRPPLPQPRSRHRPSREATGCRIAQRRCLEDRDDALFARRAGRSPRSERVKEEKATPRSAPGKKQRAPTAKSRIARRWRRHRHPSGLGEWQGRTHAPASARTAFASTRRGGTGRTPGHQGTALHRAMPSRTGKPVPHVPMVSWMSTRARPTGRARRASFAHPGRSAWTGQGQPIFRRRRAPRRAQRRPP
jgi:hypothetical protein